MSDRTAGWRTAALGVVGTAVAVAALILGVRMISGPSGGGEPPAALVGVGGTAPTITGLPSDRLQLFAAGDVALDTHREVSHDPAGDWPLAGCPIPGEVASADPGRVDFVSGLEAGPEYERAIAVGWYADTASARAAYDGLLERIRACGADRAADLAAAGLDLGSVGQVLARFTSPDGGPSEVQTHAVTLLDTALLMVVDRGTFFDGASREPLLSDVTRAEIERLADQLCADASC